jgi:hypothetical protein
MQRVCDERVADSPLEPLGAVLAAMMVAVDVGEQASAAPDLIW